MTTTTILHSLRHDWERWAVEADRSEEGWQSDYPDWAELMRAAESVMLRPLVSPEELADLELCWAISSEDETLADFAREHIDQCWNTLQRLSTSEHSDVRWQVFSVLGSAGPRAEEVLRAGLDDPDPYARRRALLSLAQLAPDDARQLAERFLRDPDPYLRQVAVELARASRDAGFMREAARQLRGDAAKHVHRAAAALDQSTRARMKPNWRTLDPARAAELLQRQDALQAEAEEVLADLDLPALLARAGRPVRVGSSVLGLMTWRDIDFNVLCRDLDADRAFETIRPLAAHPRIKQLCYSNNRGRFNATGLPQDEGYYWGMRYHTDAGDDWQLDLWFLPETAPRPEFAHLEQIPPRLTAETRLAILWIKDVWHRRSAYRGRVLSVDIYDAVLEHGARTPEDFDEYLRQRGKLAR